MRKLSSLLIALLACVTIYAESINLLDSIVRVDESTGFVDSKKIYEYHANGSMRISVNLRASWSSWKVGIPKILNSKTTFVYDEEGNEIDYYTSKLDTATGIWKDTHHYLYDEKHNRVCGVRKWNKDSTVVLQGSHYFYDEDYFQIGSDQFDTWNGVQVLDYKCENTKDAHGNKIIMVEYSKPESAWEGDYMSDPNAFNAAGWVPSDSVFYTYNEKQEKTKETIYRWDNENQEWTLDGYQIFEYDAEGHCIADTVFARDFETNVITYNNMTENTYDSHGKLSRIQMYTPNFTEDGVEWLDNGMYAYDYTYDANGKILQLRDYIDWQNSSSDIKYYTSAYYYSEHSVQEETEPCFFASGTCGENLTWELSCDSVLTIKGTGAMTSAPWINSDKAAIKYAIIGDGVTNVYRSAFWYCSNLKSVTIGNSVTQIDNYAFYECNGLSNVTLGNNVISIGNSAFSGCRALTAISLPNSLTTIEDWAFSNCRVLTSVTIPQNVASIGQAAFGGCFNLTEINVVTENSNFCSVDGVLFNKNVTTIVQYPGGLQVDYIIPNSVTTVAASAFWNCPNLTSIKIPSGVTTLGERGFSACSGLISITCEAVTPPTCGTEEFYDVDKSIPVYVPAESVDAYKAADQWKEFKNIQAISNIDPCIPISGTCGAEGDNLTWELSCEGELTISGTGEMADYSGGSDVPWYEQRENIQSLVIVDGVTSIGDSAFVYCAKMNSVTLPNSVTKIGEGAFADCNGLTAVYIFDLAAWCKINFPSFYANPLHEAKHLFINGSELSGKLDIPTSIDYIGDWAFVNCVGIMSVDIPEGVKSIGEGSFNTCVNMSEISLPNSLQKIGWASFLGCENLTNIVIPNDVTAIEEYAFRNCYNLKSVTLGDGITDIGDWSFSNCTNLQEVILGKNTQKIGAIVFGYDSNLSSIIIPNTVKSIGNVAFIDCSGLTSITCEAVTPPTLGENVFSGVDKSIPLYVPGESVEAYKDAEQWKEFNVQAIPGTEVPCESDKTILDISACSGYQFNGEWIEQSGVYFDTLVNYLGCDSIIELHLTIHSSYGGGYPSDLRDTITIEKGDSVVINEGRPWQSTIYPTETYFYNDTLRTIYGCDSIVTHYIVVTEPTFSVIFLDYNSKVLSEQRVENGKAAEAPEVSAREGYTFVGWNVDIEHIVAPTYAVAQYDKIGGTLTYLSEEGDVIATENVDLHLPEAPSIEGKSFKGWLTESADAENGIVLRATYTSDNPTTHDDVDITPFINSASVVFPFITGALTYQLVIRDLFGHVVCKIMFSATGHLLGVAFAPSHKHAQQQATQTTGFNFTVEGLDANTTYEYEFVANDETDEVIETLSGSFTTKAEVPTDNEQVNSPSAIRKYIEDGHLMIDNNARTYDARGVQIK